MHSKNILFIILVLFSLCFAPKPCEAHPNHERTPAGAVPALLKDITGNNEAQRLAALERLVFLDPADADKNAVTTMISIISSAQASPAVTSLALQVTGHFGEHAKDAVSLVLPLTKNDNPLVRRSAARALGKIGQADDQVVSALLPLLADQDSQVCFRAAEALWTLKKEQLPSELVAPLASLIDTEITLDHDEIVHFPEEYKAADLLGSLPRETATRALRASESRARVLAVLTRALGNSDGRVREAAAQGLLWAKADTPEAVLALTASLDTNEEILRQFALGALAEAGQAAKPALPKAIALSKDASPLVRAHAVYALGTIGVGSHEVIAPLITAVDDSDFGVRIFAAQALGSLGRTALPAVPRLLTLTKDASLPEDVRKTIVRALIQISKPGSAGGAQERSQPPGAPEHPDAEKTGAKSNSAARSTELPLVEFLKDESHIKYTEITPLFQRTLANPEQFSKKTHSFKQLSEYYERNLKVFSGLYPKDLFHIDLSQSFTPYDGALNLGSFTVHFLPMVPISPEDFNQHEVALSKLEADFQGQKIYGLRFVTALELNMPPAEVTSRLREFRIDLGYLADVNAKALGFGYGQLILPLSDYVEPALHFEYNGQHDWSEHSRYTRTDQVSRPIDLTNWAHQAGEKDYNISSHPDFAITLKPPPAAPAKMTFFLWKEQNGLVKFLSKPPKERLPDFILQIVFEPLLQG